MKEVKKFVKVGKKMIGEQMITDSDEDRIGLKASIILSAL